jgi:uncharacterized membrane protein
MELNRVKARRLKISWVLLVIIGIILIVTGSIGMVFITESMGLGETIMLGWGICLLIIGMGLWRWSVRELRIEKREEKMGRRNLSIGLNLIGGLWILIYGIVHLLLHPGATGWYLSPPYTIPLIIFSVIAIVGAIIEFKNLMVGSAICLISGIAILITLNIFIITFIVTTIFPIIFLIVGGALGILEARKEKVS